jgi:hypothetical protein
VRMLMIASDFQVRILTNHSGCWRELLAEQFEERRLASSVRSDEGETKRDLREGN